MFIREIILKKCEYCGNLFLPAFNKPNQKYCSKECQQKQYYKAHKEKIDEYKRQYREDNKEKIAEYQEQYHEDNKEELIEYKRQYQEVHKEELTERHKRYYEDNKEELAEYIKQYQKVNKEKIAEQKKQYYEANKEKIAKYKKQWSEDNKEQTNEHRRERYKKDYKYRLSEAFSSGVYHSLKRKGISKKGYSWEKIVGYTTQDLMKHLEEQFKDGMSWDNYGKWHIDHINPKCLFDFTSYEDNEFQRCWALKNLQPLWAKENLKKGSNLWAQEKIRK